MAAEDGGEQNASGSWVDSYVASYRYKYTWALLIFPLFAGLPAIYLVRQSGAAVAVAIGGDLLFILVFLQYKTYRVELDCGVDAHSFRFA
jgi:hypothetical protein